MGASLKCSVGDSQLSSLHWVAGGLGWVCTTQYSKAHECLEGIVLIYEILMSFDHLL